MVKTSKHIGIYFVWVAMLVIIGHSIIPHHHHSDVVTCQQSCEHGDKERDSEPDSGIASLTGHQCETSHQHDGCESCQFETTATTPLSKIVINYSLFASEWLKSTILPESSVIYFDSWSNHYTFDFSNHTSSRGPPALG